MTDRKKIYVITGGPGFGKSTIINSLEKKGFYCAPDIARDIIKEQLDTEGDVLPWKNMVSFAKEVAQRRVTQYKEAPDGRICFFDGGIPDPIAYLIKYGLEIPDEIYFIARKYCYEKSIFVTFCISEVALPEKSF